MKRILIKVWQGKLSPQRAVNELMRAGPLICPEKRQRILDILCATAEKEITVNEAEEGIREEGVEYEENPCHI